MQEIPLNLLLAQETTNLDEQSLTAIQTEISLFANSPYFEAIKMCFDSAAFQQVISEPDEMLRLLNNALDQTTSQSLVERHLDDQKDVPSDDLDHPLPLHDKDIYQALAKLLVLFIQNSEKPAQGGTKSAVAWSEFMQFIATRPDRQKIIDHTAYLSKLIEQKSSIQDRFIEQLRNYTNGKQLLEMIDIAADLFPDQDSNTNTMNIGLLEMFPDDDAMAKYMRDALGELHPDPLQESDASNRTELIETIHQLATKLNTDEDTDLLQRDIDVIQQLASTIHPELTNAEIRNILEKIGGLLKAH